MHVYDLDFIVDVDEDLDQVRLFVSALLFGDDRTTSHPKHIGGIDPSCNVPEVVKGEQNTTDPNA